MRKIHLLVVFLIAGKSVFSHNPQVSTLSIIQHENKKWSVFVTAPLYTCQLAATAEFPKLNADSLDVYALQHVVIALIKNSLRINGKKNSKVANTKIQVAHETTVYFDIEDTAYVSDVDFKAFSKLRDHFTLLKIVPHGSKEITYILNSENKYVYAPNKKEGISSYFILSTYTGFFNGIRGGYMLIAGVALLFACLLFKRRFFYKKAAETTIQNQ